jgi:hypothetical protein
MGKLILTNVVVHSAAHTDTDVLVGALLPCKTPLHAHLLGGGGFSSGHVWINENAAANRDICRPTKQFCRID